MRKGTNKAENTKMKLNQIGLTKREEERAADVL